MSTVESSLASAAVKNPMFQKAAKKAMFEAVMGQEDDEEQQQNTSSSSKQIKDGSVLDVTEDELKQLKKYALYMKWSMIVIATLLMAVSWYNFLSTSSSSFATTFLAAYLFFFAIMICCFECAFRQAALIIVQNFGFMYSMWGRWVFLSFVAILSYQISTFGKVMFGMLVLYAFATAFVYYKHPQYGKYLRTLHFFNRAKSGVRK